MKAAWTVYLKELVDALRDRRTLAMVLLSSVAIGPLVLVLLSSLVAGFEKRAEAREVVVEGLAHAPTLQNYLQRQTYRVREAPVDFRRLLHEGRFGDPVLVAPPGFEAALANGSVPELELLSSSGDKRADGGVGAVLRLLRGFNDEQATLRLALRGVAPAVLQAVRVQARDLSDAAARAAQWTAMLPFFVLMAVLYGSLHAALDTTAGERERGSLEPLLMNPTPRRALVLGKWGAVASVGMLIAVLSCLSFLPGQWLLRSEALAAMFRFGIVEALAFTALLLPLAGALAALLMAIAIRCRSFKEAQANATVLVLAVSLLPLLTVFSQDGPAPWHRWVPALAQSALMGRILRGESPGALDVAISAAVCGVVTLVALIYVARVLRRTALG